MPEVRQTHEHESPGRQYFRAGRRDAAAKRYEKFMEDHRGQNVVFLELGVGYNTPGIIKYNFWKYAYNWRNAFYVCINKGDAYVPKEIENKTVGVDADLAEVIEKTSSLT